MILHDQAFADDLSIVSSSPQKMQATIDVFAKSLNWAKLFAKWQKCISLALKKFDPRNEHKEDYERYAETVYRPYDPNLMIAGKKMKFIVNTDVTLSLFNQITSKN